jgi:hypothetical protein
VQRIAARFACEVDYRIYISARRAFALRTSRRRNGAWVTMT